jgi:type IV secretion system protein VirB9
MKKRKIALAVVGAVLSGLALSASAMSQKEDSPYDHRIKSVAYNAQDTVELDTVVGTDVMIRFSPGEEYVIHAFGDKGSYSLAHKLNYVFLRPIAPDADTNLTLVTSKHTYNLLLHYIGDETVKGADGKPTKTFITTPWSVRQATVELDYTYPDTDAEKAHAKYEKARLNEALQKGEKQGDRNVDYTMSDQKGMESIRPMNVWDDFRFTSFKFPANAILPQVFFIDADGHETTPNFHIEGPDHNIIVAENVAKQWVIRSGDKVVGVVNHDFDPARGSNASGTTAAGVVRVLKANPENDE